MPDFIVVISGQGAQVPWTDPASENPPAPSRVNPNPLHPHTYHRVSMGLLSPDETKNVVLTCWVAGVEAPLDGPLFSGAWAKWSGTSAPPPFVSPAGQSSITTITFDHSHLGHHVFRLSHVDGGTVLLHFDVELGS